MLLSAKKEYVEIPTANCHAGTLCRFQGRLYLAWFGGTREGENDVDIYVTCRDEDQWREPVRISVGDVPHWNPVLLAKEDHIDLFFKAGKRPIATWQTQRVRLDGDLRILTPPAELVPGDVGGRGPVKNKCLRLKNGTLLAPASTEDGVWQPYIDISEDNGETFTDFIPIPLYRFGEKKPPVMDRPYCFAQGVGAIQPSLWQSADGAVHCLMRSAEGVLLRSDSEDNGRSWCPAYRTVLPNNNSGIDLVGMEDGSLVLAMNPVSENWGARSPLTLFVSNDNGEHFKPFLTLEDRPGEFSYPALIREGKTVYVAYTWDRVRMAVWTLNFE